MRIMPTSVARAAKRARTRSDWRPLTTGEAVVAAVVDLLLLIVVVLVPMLALNVKALPWILLAQVIVAQSLVLARFGRTAGLATVSATVVVPQQGAAPGIGRALVRVLLPLLLPFQISPHRSAGQSGKDRERLLDRLTRTLTVTRRAMPEQAQQGLAGRTRTKPRRSRRGSKSVATPPVAPEVMTRGPVQGGGRQPSAGPMATGAPVFQPPAPPVQERPGLAGPAYTGAFAGTGVPAAPAPVAASGSGAARSRFAPPVVSPAPPPSTAHSPVAPTPPPASLPPSPVPAAPGSSPITPSVFAAPPGPPTSSMPVGAAPSATSAPPSAPAPQAPAPASPSLPPSLPPRIQPARQQTASPPPPAVGSAPSAAGGVYAAARGIRSGTPDAPGGPVGPQHAQPPVIPPSSAASAASSSSGQYPPTPSVSGGPDSSTPAGPPSVQPRGRQPKAM